MLIERHAVGGQAGSSSAIENYMGFPDGVAGAELAERARQQAVKFGAELLMMREGIKAEFRDGRIIVDLAEGGQLRARANICATGVEWRKLGLVDEGRLLGRGLYYGAGMSEAPMCASEQVVVVGAGNSAGQAAMHLATYAAKVTMLVRGEGLGTTLSQYLVERITCTPNIEVVTGSEVKGLHGDDMLAWIDVATRGQPLRTMETSRLFVCIGGQPNTDWASQTPIVRDAQGYLVTGPDLTDGTAKPSGWTLERAPFFLETSVAGSFAAGDVRRNSVKRIASAVGEGAMAVTFVHQYLAESR